MAYARLVAVASFCLGLAGTAASGDSKSFGAVKNRFPPNVAGVFGLDLTALRPFASFPKLIEQTLDNERDLKEAVTLIKTVCGFDPVAAVSDVTIVTEGGDDAIIALGLKALDEAKLIACLNKIIQRDDPKAKVTAKPGKVTEYSMTGETQKLYAAWLAKDVVAFGTDIGSRVALDAVVAGKPAGGQFASLLAKTNPRAFAFGALVIGKDGVQSCHGTITASAGKLGLALKLTTLDENMGRLLLDEASKKVGDVARRLAANSPAARIVSALRLTGGGNEIAVELSIAEADIPGMLVAFDALF